MVVGGRVAVIMAAVDRPVAAGVAVILLGW